MLIIAHHNVSDPQKFWGSAEDIINKIPSSMKLHGVFPARDGKTGTCIWEAENVSDVQKFLDDNSKESAKNFCYEIDTNKSMGLPAFHLDEAHA